MNFENILPKGFSLSVALAGFKYKNRPDLALIFSKNPASCAAVFTTNAFQAAPIKVAKHSLSNSPGVRAVLVNAGQANACTGKTGEDNCRRTLEILAQHLGIDAQDILPASTGVIGDHLKMDLFEKYLPQLVKDLGSATPDQASRAIMTTDTYPKTACAEIELDGGRVRFWGMAKGAGMICPNMATMLGFILTDLQIDPGQWQQITFDAVDMSFNALTIDGDTSTNDCVFALAGGESQVSISGKPDMHRVSSAMHKICSELAYDIVKDAEGGTKVLRIKVRGALDREQARRAASTIGNSPLVKTAMYGQDPNWGRIIAALGRSNARFDPDKVKVTLAGIEIFSAGQPVDMDRDAVFKPLLAEKDIQIEIDLFAGKGEFELLASDLTEKYIEINAHYRT